MKIPYIGLLRLCFAPTNKVFFFFSCLAFKQKNIIIKSRKTNKSNENPTECNQWGFLVLFVTRCLIKTVLIMPLNIKHIEKINRRFRERTRTALGSRTELIFSQRKSQLLSERHRFYRWRGKRTRVSFWETHKWAFSYK